jgi:hypothetical protein
MPLFLTMDFTNLLKDINMVLEYETLELPALVPSVHNDILNDFRSCESGELPGALAIALERAESAQQRANLDRLTGIRGTRVQINLNLGQHPPTLRPSLCLVRTLPRLE